MKNIIGSYLMPHPPIIIPDIGKGEESKIKETTESCNKIAKEISDNKPETIILITPHGTMFSDAVAISHEASISGDLRQFRAINIKMNISIDTDFNEKLNLNCQSENISCGLVDSKLLSKYNHEFTLDHGAMVPLYFVNKFYNDYKLVHITYSMIGSINLYKFGMAIRKTAEELNCKCVIIASGDLSHKLKEDGPYSYSPYGPEFDYEGPFGVGYGVMKFNNTEEKSDVLSQILNETDEHNKRKLSCRNPYTRLARKNLIHYFKFGSPIADFSGIDEELLQSKHGVFVSMKKFGALRGCIGTILPSTQSLAQEIINNSLSAAFKDPRFPPVSENELSDIDISVDVLTTPVKADKNELNPKKYGVIVSKGYKRGLLLPDLEGVDTVSQQLQIACDKGEIDFFEDDYQIEKFEVVRYTEDD